MKEWNDDLFDEAKIKKAVNKGKRKTFFKMITIAVLVFLLLNVLNFVAYLYFSQRAFKQMDASVRLSTPNAYISHVVESVGILGGQAQYKVKKDMKHKAVAIEQSQYSFGLIPSLSISRGAGGSIGVTGEDWQLSYKDNGWQELIFFHPSVTYKQYKNDETLIQELGDDHIYEVAFSFDKPYKPSDLPIFEFPAMSWFWINTYDDEAVKSLQQHANETDWSANFIREREALGFSQNAPSYSISSLEFGYESFLNLLQTSNWTEHKNAYKLLKDKDFEDTEILGMVLYGTKEELQKMFDHPIVKAVSLGGVVDHY